MLSYLPFIITVFSALRLAKFNIDTRQTNSFIGLPTPACTIFVTGFALVLEFDRFDLTPTLLNTYIITGLSLILSYLLVAEIPLFALKFKNFNWSENKAQYTLILVSVVSILTLQFLAIPLIIVLYLILSLIYPSQPTTNISENN
jgi:CDP-diacylglycerol--serine O-phosphatidyltransferase